MPGSKMLVLQKSIDALNYSLKTMIGCRMKDSVQNLPANMLDKHQQCPRMY